MHANLGMGELRLGGHCIVRYSMIKVAVVCLVFKAVDAETNTRIRACDWEVAQLKSEIQKPLNDWTSFLHSDA